MTAKQKELRLPDYVEHVIEASALDCSYVEGMSIESFRTEKPSKL